MYIEIEIKPIHKNSVQNTIFKYTFQTTYTCESVLTKLN